MKRLVLKFNERLLPSKYLHVYYGGTNVIRFHNNGGVRRYYNEHGTGKRNTKLI